MIQGSPQPYALELTLADDRAASPAAARLVLYDDAENLGGPPATHKDNPI